MYKRILVPVDGSDTANKALQTALQLAKDAGGCVRLVHVIEELAYVSGYAQFGVYSEELLKAIRETGSKVLQDAMTVAQIAGVEADNMLFDNFGGRLAEIITDAANEWKADLIVVGTHGRRGVGRLLLGSGAEQIIRLAPVPVLVIRSGKNGAK
ncbi:universal stress protein [Polaromonas sp.]|uniref:universal stress protein n=1 Tax=Polaromonas sp. TaxID=1869339 RepID=UPI0017A17BA7|nr:universal stress protein [Polaromonas sp.]NML87090.1 universal stress protein [Polaromonas sp.]